MIVKMDPDHGAPRIWHVYRDVGMPNMPNVLFLANSIDQPYDDMGIYGPLRHAEVTRDHGAEPAAYWKMSASNTERRTMCFRFRSATRRVMAGKHLVVCDDSDKHVPASSGLWRSLGVPGGPVT